MNRTAIVVPRLGLTVTEVTLISWAADAGTAVRKGDVIAVVETDKVETELEAPDTGLLIPTADVGGTYPVGAVIGTIAGPATEGDT